MENATKEDIQKIREIMKEKIAEVMDLLEATSGMSREAILDNFTKEMPVFIEKMKSGNINYIGIDGRI